MATLTKRGDGRTTRSHSPGVKKKQQSFNGKLTTINDSFLNKSRFITNLPAKTKGSMQINNNHS